MLISTYSPVQVQVQVGAFDMYIIYIYTHHNPTVVLFINQIGQLNPMKSHEEQNFSS